MMTCPGIVAIIFVAEANASNYRAGSRETLQVQLSFLPRLSLTDLRLSMGRIIDGSASILTRMEKGGEAYLVNGQP